MKPQTIAKGAEATIYLNNNQITKSRIKKSYRHEELDKKLRKHRTKSEAKIISKLSKVINVPKIIETDDKETIIMDFIDGQKLSDNLENLDYKEIAKQIGEIITKIHDQDIIHGDLTTSNMILKNDQLFFIDFGLAFHSYKLEDKAVDLHLLSQALDAKHFSIFKEIWKIILESYKPERREEILNQLKKVESRGRYKDKY
ncbi:Kae1-associated kinase Bud32 [Candidatus Pacearchaeota archaeon]|nr:Kae1-associated kinase Bud32 [Candidatus Pacearchaeota archaeon]|tara:strand:- start:1097 stop:1696 length:600 start_codon:yes stop_codon:yes gene_type:complete